MRYFSREVKKIAQKGKDVGAVPNQEQWGVPDWLPTPSPIP